MIGSRNNVLDFFAAYEEIVGGGSPHSLLNRLTIYHSSKGTLTRTLEDGGTTWWDRTGRGRTGGGVADYAKFLFQS